MKSTDKILLGIVIGIVVLIVVAFVVSLIKPEPMYRGEDTPEGVAYNYLLALQREDYERAYGYLSPTLKGVPQSADSLVTTVKRYEYSFGFGENVTLEIDSAELVNELAFVEVTETHFSRGGLFDSGKWDRSFDMELRLVEGEWKVIDSDRYFVSCWKKIEGCD